MTPRIRIGNQTAYSSNGPMDPFDFALAHGFDCFEWFADKKFFDDGTSRGWNESDFDPYKRDEIRRLGRARDILYTVHAPWQANPLHESGAALLRNSIDFAHDIGASLMNLHLYMDQDAECYVKSMLPVIAYATEKRMHISIENTPLTTPDDFNRTFELFGKHVDLSHVGMCLDIGHANVCELTRNDFLRYIDMLSPQVPITHLHVHENNGDSDSHLTLFTGPSSRNDSAVRGFIERMKARNYQGAMILEQWPHPPWMLVEAESRLRTLIGIPRPAIKHSPAPAMIENGEAPPHDADPHPAAGEFVKKIVAANKSLKSWRERLQWVRELFVAPEFNPGLEQLVALAVYLRFLATGEVQCQEDGRHFRPNHHANAAQSIEEALERLSTPERQWILRRIYPWLPSVKSEFRRHEPLTRIRDIAHRNDIPRDLKNEIKHRLQNKLHRCAGPEDLKTSQDILARITAPNTGYAGAFVSEFKIFHAELSEFFNATALERRLHDLNPVLPAKAENIRLFLSRKQERERAHGDVVEVLEALTVLRHGLAAELKGANAEVRAEIRLADIGLEDYAFALLSESANKPDVFSNNSNLSKYFRTLLIGIENIGLSGLEPEECAALHSELAAWDNEFSMQDRFHLLRFKATLARMQRLAEAYSEKITALFPKCVEQLGGALGVNTQAIRFYCEGDIRGNLVFQLARLVSIGLKAVREILKLGPWEAIVPGAASGALLRVASLQDLEGVTGPVVALLDKSSGEDEIPACVRAIVLGHDIPHLSHLAVRARQSRVPFAVTESARDFGSLAKHIGGNIGLEINSSGLFVHDAEAGAAATNGGPQTPATSQQIPSAVMSDECRLLPIEQADASLCGAKAAGARTLLDLARQSEGLFLAPRALALQFGAMESCLRDSPMISREYDALLSRAGGNGALPDDVLKRLRQLLPDVPIPPEIQARIALEFGENARLAVRSSANGEDLENLAGAGLYDSVVNVPPAEASNAIRKVWASLWSRRATFARQQGGIAHDRIHMAVLIQEMVHPEFSFIMHTANPLNGNRAEPSVELAAGLGEVLASASEAGSPYRLICGQNGNSTILSFASYASALVPSPNSSGGVIRARLDYSKVPLSRDPQVLRSLAGRFSRIAAFLDAKLGRPQDVEGVIENDRIHLVQSRPQQGL